MSKHQGNCSVPFAACAAIVLGGLAAPAPGQNRVLPRAVPERHFTLAPSVYTPMVLKTEPDAECSLHRVGDFDAAHSMKLYANGDGYVRVHLTAKPDSQDNYLQLDCVTADAVTVHPIHLRTGSSPTEDMPEPDASMPTPRGAQVLAALTEETARQLSDSEVIRLGYPPRPDATQAPALYSAWLDVVCRPMTLLPPNRVSHTDVSHQRPGIEEGTAESSGNWSGFELRNAPFTYVNVSANWRVPAITSGEYGKKTYSALWVGLDGDPNGDKLAGRDLVQDGTESDASDFGGILATNYYAWTELVPTQPLSVPQFTVNWGDEIFAHVWVGDSSGHVSLYGLYYWFYIGDVTQRQAVQFSMPYSSTDPFTGSEAEWIMERPTLVSGTLSNLSNYGFASIQNAAVLNVTTGKYIQPSAASRQITMYDSANNVLSSATALGAGAIQFQWFRFH